MTGSVVETNHATQTALQRGMHDQLAQWRRTVQRQGQRLGWKIGFSDLAAQQRQGLTAPVIGYLRRDRLLADGDVYPLPVNHTIKAEVEVAIRLGRDVRAGSSAAQAAAAIAAYAPAVELVDVTQPLDGLEALLRGNLYHAAVRIGPERTSIPVSPRASIQAHLSVDGKPLRESEPSRLPEHFSELVHVTAETLSLHGEYLAAGDWIICGAIMEPLVVTPGNRIDIDMTSFARLSLNFSAA